MNREVQRMANNTLNGLAVGAMLFFTGLFVTVCSWGAASPLGIPLMVAGILFPFLEAYLGHQEPDWAGEGRRSGG